MTDRIENDVLDAVERDANATISGGAEFADRHNADCRSCTAARAILALVAAYRASAPAARHAATDAVIAAAIVPDDRAPVPASVPVCKWCGAGLYVRVWRACGGLIGTHRYCEPAEPETRVPASVPDLEAWAERLDEIEDHDGDCARVTAIERALRAAWEHREP